MKPRRQHVGSQTASLTVTRYVNDTMCFLTSRDCGEDWQEAADDERVLADEEVEEGEQS